MDQRRICAEHLGQSDRLGRAARMVIDQHDLGIRHRGVPSRRWMTVDRRRAPTACGEGSMAGIVGRARLRNPRSPTTSTLPALGIKTTVRTNATLAPPATGVPVLIAIILMAIVTQERTLMPVDVKYRTT